MPFTEADLTAINAALAAGALAVRFSDGRQVTYQSVDNLLRARRIIADEIAATATGRRMSSVYVTATKGL